MGRPLNKKYFGNENTGDSGATSANYTGTPGSGQGIGGDSVSSVTIGTAGSYTSRLPTVTFSDPNLGGAVGGVTATGTVHGKVVSAAVTTNGSGYNYGDVLSITGGTYDTQGTVTVTEITVVGTPTVAAGGSGYNDGDLLTFSGAGWSQDLILRVNRPGGGTGTPDNFTVTQVGRRTAAAPTNPVAYTSRTGSGNGATANITWGVYSTSTVSQEGDYTAVASGARATTASPAGGTGATVTVSYGVKSIEITDPGSGYTTVADAVPAFSTAGGGEVLAVGTSVLTTDSGTPYTRDAFNTIIAYGIPVNGGTNKIGDITKQQSTRRYKLKTADGWGFCKLVAATPSAEGEMTIKATDNLGGTYYVTKLTAHLATVTQNTGTKFATNDNIHWTFTTGDSTYDADTTVIIENA